MIVNERQDRTASVIEAARRIMTAARTAPKSRGNDLVEVAMVTGEDIQRLSQAMAELFEITGRPVYQRDSANILSAEAVIVIGVQQRPMELNCGHCGFETCATKPSQAPCAMNATDVGIAIGSAVSMAADLRIDARVMFSAGMGAKRLGILDGCGQMYAIPLSASSKNPFFDRG